MLVSRSLTVFAFSGGLALMLASCQSIKNSEAVSTEQLLAASGFEMKLADTPDRLAHLQTLTQRTLAAHEQDGQIQYVYADADGCKCLYTGSQAQYDAYQKMLVEEQYELNPEAAAAMHGDAPMDWGLWGPRGLE